RRVVALDAGVLDGRAGNGADVGKAAIAHGSGRGAGGDGFVVPAGLVVQHVLLPERADDAAQAPVIRRAQPELVLLVLVLLGRAPEGARGEAGGLKVRVVVGRAIALVVVGIDAARVV